MPIFGQIRMKTANFTPDLGYTASCFRPFLERDEEGLSSCLVYPCHRAVALTPPE